MLPADEHSFDGRSEGGRVTGVRSAVRLRRLPLAAGGYLARLTLNAPQKLNAMNLEMASALLRHLRSLADDPEAVAIFLDGAGEGAFCAGADLKRLREAALSSGGERVLEAEHFFETQYRLNHLLHTYPKPVICWAQGIVMGGGLGMLVAASHRIVTLNSQLAVPEVRVGLHPEAGATWFLNQMPEHMGLFVALTGAQMNSGDALYTGLADYCFAGFRKAQLLEALLSHGWQFDAKADREGLTDLLTDMEVEQAAALPESPLKKQRELIARGCRSSDVERTLEAIRSYRGDDGWMATTRDNLEKGCASSAKLIFQLQRRGRELSLADAFRLEMVVSANRIRDPEFAEGVRAQLVEKDRHPTWAFPSVAEVPDAVIDALFVAPWPKNPLVDL